MYKCFHDSLPMSFAFFTKLSDIHNYDTRNKSCYNLTRTKKKKQNKTKQNKNKKKQKQKQKKNSFI